MRAVMVERYGGPEVLKPTELPEPQPRPGQVSIEVAYAGINYADVMARRDGYQVSALPFVPGLELSGTVRALGSGATGFRLGQPVAAFVPSGGYAQVAVAGLASVYPLPEGTDLREAATWLAVLPTAYALLHRIGRLAAGETVLVHSAAGGVGTAIGQLARAAGAAAVYGVVSSPRKVAFALRFGYDRVFVGDRYAAALAEATGGRGVDLILDPVGGETLRTGLSLLARFGRLVSYGNAGAQEPWRAGPGELYPRALSVSGFSLRAISREEPALLRQITESAIRAARAAAVQTPITGEYALEEVAEAHRMLESRATTGKLVARVAEH
ncbi:zinc-binding dehydrogenase [Actinocrinis puniceicyclus]|uniref:Zinc-binding dehydrogenase n=1 Tax=Actinocrinis puniceicyclus TaxID=977794 RepID=A0A8J7WFU2_9ACTN|nr:zinc-binding dehydrogenase [Actinocrinis puniceicyclus]MBS2961408.1 zinc-binding dehydrogenase [Actinocrinis puniceicyclus]